MQTSEEVDNPSRKQYTLFDHAHIELPIASSIIGQSAPLTGDSQADTPHLFLVLCDGSRQPRSEQHLQLALPLSAKENPVVDFFCKRQQSYLDYHVRDLLNGQMSLKPIINRLEARNIYHVGELVSFSSTRLQQQRIASPHQIRQLSCFLGKGGLKLGMYIPHWRPPRMYRCS